MIKLQYKVRGRAVSQNQFIDNLRKEALRIGESTVRSRVRQVRCPVHNQTAAMLSKVGTSPMQFGFCCEKLKAEVERALR